MADPIKRPNYFNGQLLTEDDFNLAQDYLMARDSWHGRLLHSPGIADGLTVDAGVGASQARVTPGSCMDANGRPIVLVEETVLPLDRLANQTVLVVISYTETRVDPAGAGGFTRWEERPKVEVVQEGAGAPAEATHLRLARLVLDANSKVQQHDASVRRSAGVRLGNELELRRLSLSREGLASSSWPALTCGAAGRVEINSGSGTLSPGLALSTPGGEDFFSIYGARQDKPSHDLLWRRGTLRLGTATSAGGQAFSEKLRITEAGNVGIGTQAPTERLHVGGNARIDGSLSSFRASDGTNAGAVNVGRELGSENLWHITQRSGDQDKLMIFRRNPAAPTLTPPLPARWEGPYLTITPDGKVGIGTAAPGAEAKLEVKGELHLNSGEADGARLVWLAQGKTEWRARNNTTLDFFQQEGNPAVLTLHPSGNVGIGVQGPADKLHVAGNIRLDLGKEIFFTDNGQIRSADDNHRILFRRTENKLEIREWGDLIFSPGATGGQETAKVVILANGNVGIGTKAPAAALHVGGVSVLAQEAWKAVTSQDFQRGWRNFGEGYNNAAFMKDSLGFVHLIGLVKDGALGPIFILPEGYRPAKRHRFSAVTSPNILGRIDVWPNGEVRVEHGSSDWTSLDGITFQAGFTRGFDLGNIDVDRFNPNLIPGIRGGPVGPQLPPVP